MKEILRRTGYEHERRWRLEGLDYFETMVHFLREASQSRGLERESAMASVLGDASRTLNSPIEQRAAIVRAFQNLRTVDPDLAKASLRTLRAAGDLNERELRRFLELPERGRIFPKAK